MRSLAILAVAATAAIGLLATNADAAGVAAFRVAPVVTTSSDQNVCVAACIPVPPRHRLSNAEYKACGDQLADLRRVTVRQIKGVDPVDIVHLVPLCDINDKSLTQQQWSYLARGNVQGLVPAIAANDTLMAELDDRGYAANDVIGVAVAPNAAILYVSRR